MQTTTSRPFTAGRHLQGPACSTIVVNARASGLHRREWTCLGIRHSTPEPGHDIKLTHYWKMVASPGDGWKPFTHLEGPNRQSFINADHPAVKGKYPPSAWKPGEIIRDEHVVRLPANWSHDTVIVYTGFWRGNARLPLKSGAHDAGGAPGPAL